MSGPLLSPIARCELALDERLERPVAGINDLGTDSLADEPVQRMPWEEGSSSEQTLWHKALVHMTMIKDMPEPSRYDSFWPRHVLVNKRLHLVRECRDSEQALLDSLAKGTSDPFVWRNTLDSWRSLIAYVLMNADLCRQETLDWLLCASLCKVSDERKSFLGEQKEAVFSSLAKRARTLMPDRPGLGDLAGAVPLTAGNPLVLIQGGRIEQGNLPKEPVWDKPFASDEEERAWTTWSSWMHRRAEEDVLERGAPMDVFAWCNSMQRVWPVSFEYSRMRHSMGYESTYVWRHQWNMIDDPMHSVSSSLASWNNSVHPLCELGALFHSRDHWAYLAHRLSAWARDTTLTSRAVESGPVGDAASMDFTHMAAHMRLLPETVLGQSLSPVPEDSQAAQEETFQASELVERIKRARQELQSQAPAESAPTRQAPARQHVSQTEQAWKMATIVTNRGWVPLIDDLRAFSLSVWDSAVDAKSMPASMGASGLVCRMAFEDLCSLVQTLPGQVAVWDLKRSIAELPHDHQTGIKNLMGEEVDFIDLSLDSTVAKIDQQAYWCAYLAKHGSMARFFRKGVLEKTEHSGIMQTMASLLCAAPLLFDRDNAASQSRRWTSKTLVIAAFIGSIAQACWRDDACTGALSVYLASVMLEESMLRGMDASLLWFKLLRTLARREHEPAEARQACLDPTHNLFEMVAKPQFCPDVAKFDWTWDEVRALQRILGDTVDESADVSVSTRRVFVPRVSVSAAWSAVGAAKKQEEKEEVNVPFACTAKGAILLLEYCQWLVCKTIPYRESVRARLVEQIEKDRGDLVRRTQTADAVAARWVRWAEQESARKMDRTAVVRGARISLFGDHPWVQLFALGEWVGRPWISC